MSTDAKMGLVIGVGLVITVGAVYFRKDSAFAWQSKEDKAFIPGRSPQPKPAPAPPNQTRSVPAKKTGLTDENRQALIEPEKDLPTYRPPILAPLPLTPKTTLWPPTPQP
jgi:hypothetical protein